MDYGDYLKKYIYISPCLLYINILLDLFFVIELTSDCVLCNAFDTSKTPYILRMLFGFFIGSPN